MPCPRLDRPALTPQISVLLLVCLSCLVAPEFASAQWRVEPTLAAGLELDDNARLQPDEFGEQSIDGYTASVAADFRYESPLTEFSLIPEFRLRRFDDSTFDANDTFVEFRFDRTGQLSNFSLRGNFSDQTTRTGERSDVDFNIDDPDEIPVDDSGLIAVVRDRQRLLLAPDFSYRFGERTAIALGATYIDTSFESVGAGVERDYTISMVDGALEFDTSERDTLSLWAYHRSNDFEANNRGSVSGEGVGLGYRRAVSEQTEFRLRLGVDRSEIASGSEPTNTVGEIALTRRFETGRLIASYQRVVGGSGAAVVSVRDGITLSGRRNLSERTTVGLGLRLYRTDAIESVAESQFDEREYAQLRALFNWRATQVFTVELDYRLTFLDREVFPSSASSNQLNVWFKYSPIL